MNDTQSNDMNELRSTTIANALNSIQHNDYQLTEIQRYFTWSHEQVEKLFDSLMRDYILNTFIFWQVKSPEIKKSYEFYEFLSDYQKFQKTNNPSHTTQLLDKDFIAVIDGQQRLTAFNIGLRGTFAFRPKGSTDIIYAIQPPRKLYLNLSNLPGIETTQSENNEEEYEEDRKLYDFRFLIKKDVVAEKIKGQWFEVPEIMNIASDNENTIHQYLTDKNLIDENNEEQAVATVQKLWRKIHQSNLIHYYLVQNQNASSLLGMFVRTNSGGTPLTYSDLFMSFAFAKWKSHTIDKVREEMEELVAQVLLETDFLIDKNFIWRACLMLTDNSIRVNLDDLTAKIGDFSENWEQIRECILGGFALIKKLGYSDATFGSKNTALPILYYIYRLNLAETVKDSRYYSGGGRKTIGKWIRLTLLKSVLATYADTSLSKMRTIISDEIQRGNTVFPLEELTKNTYAGNRNYVFTTEEIEKLLESRYKSPQALALLQFLYPGLDYSCSIHEDHLHPQSIFPVRLTRISLDQFLAKTQIPAQDRDFAVCPRFWDSVLNLQLLNDTDNREKTDKPLEEWAAAHQERPLFVEAGTSLNIADFRAFIESRKRVLTAELSKILLPE